MDRSAALDVLRAAPEHTAVMVDFDGTLSPIVEDPAAARPLPGAAATLTALHERFAQVAVVSGRPVSYLVAHLPPEITLSGLYGLEGRRGGVAWEHPGAAVWRAVVDEVVAEARRDVPPGVEVEHKGLSLTLHVRPRPDLAPAAAEWAAGAASRSGLHVRPAKMSVELHPPVDVDKGTVVEDLVGMLDGACYVGDDVGDVPAFDALDRLAGRGRTAVRVAVETPEADHALLARADLRVRGPEGALAFLAALA